MDFLFESIYFPIKAAEHKNDFKAGKNNKGGFKTN